MKKMYGFMLVLALGSVGSAHAKHALVYPVEIQNRSGQSIDVGLFYKNKGGYGPDQATWHSKQIQDSKSYTFNIGSTDLVQAQVTVGNTTLTIDLVAPYAKYLIDKEKNGTYTVDHRGTKATLKTGEMFNW